MRARGRSTHPRTKLSETSETARTAQGGNYGRDRRPSDGSADSPGGRRPVGRATPSLLRSRTSTRACHPPRQRCPRQRKSAGLWSASWGFGLRRFVVVNESTHLTVDATKRASVFVSDVNIRVRICDSAAVIGASRWPLAPRVATLCARENRVVSRRRKLKWCAIDRSAIFSSPRCAALRTPESCSFQCARSASRMRAPRPFCDRAGVLESRRIGPVRGAARSARHKRRRSFFRSHADDHGNNWNAGAQVVQISE
jgi:hypothetical protein